MEKEVIVASIFRKLFWMRKIGASHTAFDNLPKSFPRDMGADLKKVGKELIRKNYLLARKHNYGLGISLNPKRLGEIVKITKKIYPSFKKRYS